MKTMNIELDCYHNINGSKNPSVSIKTYPLSQDIEVEIIADEKELIRQMLKNFSLYDLLEEMTDAQKQELTDYLFERYAVGEIA